MATMPVERGFYVTSHFGARWGTTHYGTDFGCDGGSGGKPIFSVRDGVVNRVGTAAGFGQWITVDHPAEVGGGTSVYGHIIPEVKLGQRVSEGQRIGRINPDSRTNGGVAPHLHFEFHRSVWVPPGPDRLDPMATVLKNAAWPGEDHRPARGTIFGVDVSEHQDGMSLRRAAAEGIQFAIIRTTDGTYRDRTYRSHVDDARGTDMALAAYHYLRNPSEGTSVRAQVKASLDVMGADHRLPVWIDCETDAGLHPDQIRECKRAFEEAGVRVLGVYSYIPYWEGRISGGEPKTAEFGHVWLAWYGSNPDGAPQQSYPGDAHRMWDYPLGDQKPLIWQFTSEGDVAGFARVDVNAFRGSLNQLKAIFAGQAVPADKEELSVSDANRIIEVVEDTRQQLTGSRKHGEYAGWEQLGQDGQGRNLTMVDAIAALRQDVVNLTKEIRNLIQKVGK